MASLQGKNANNNDTMSCMFSSIALDMMMDELDIVESDRFTRSG